LRVPFEANGILLADEVAVGAATAVENVEEMVEEMVEEKVAGGEDDTTDAVGIVIVVVAVVAVELDELVEALSANTPPDANGEVLAVLAPSANTPALVDDAAGAGTAVTAPGLEVSPKYL
jgi:hypothetical protein